MRDITYREFFNAIRKNGYKQAFKTMFIDSYGGRISAYEVMHDQPHNAVMGACALGQAYLNLGIRQKDVPITSAYDEMCLSVVRLNDDIRLPLNEIADRMEVEFADRLDQTLLIVGAE